MVNNFSFGIEIEYYGISHRVAQAAFLAAGIKGWSNVTAKRLAPLWQYAQHLMPA